MNNIKDCKTLEEMKLYFNNNGGDEKFPQFYEYSFNSINQMEKFIENRMVLICIDIDGTLDLSLYIR